MEKIKLLSASVVAGEEYQVLEVEGNLYIHDYPATPHKVMMRLKGTGRLWTIAMPKVVANDSTFIIVSADPSADTAVVVVRPPAPVIATATPMGERRNIATHGLTLMVDRVYVVTPQSAIPLGTVGVRLQCTGSYQGYVEDPKCKVFKVIGIEGNRYAYIESVEEAPMVGPVTVSASSDTATVQLYGYAWIHPGERYAFSGDAATGHTNGTYISRFEAGVLKRSNGYIERPDPSWTYFEVMDVEGTVRATIRRIEDPSAKVATASVAVATPSSFVPGSITTRVFNEEDLRPSTSGPIWGGVNIMNGFLYSGVVVRNKTIAAGEGVTSGVVVSEIVHESGKFIAASDETARGIILAEAVLAAGANTDGSPKLKLNDPLASVEVRLLKA